MFTERMLPHLTTLPSLAQVSVGRPDLSKWTWESRIQTGVNLWVGGHNHPAEGNWETLDPYDPGEVTYRGKLEDPQWACALRNRFGVVIADAVFEHINPLLYKECIENVHAMLKTEGLFKVEVPWLWAYHVSSSAYHFGGDFVRFTDEGLRRIFEDHPTTEWRVLACEYFTPEECQDGVGVFGLFMKWG